MPYFEEAKQNGAYIIVIDPRETATAKIADLHLKIKPGTDAALANGMLKIIIEEQLTDGAFIRDRAEGFEEVKRHVASLSLEDISAKTGIQIEQIKKPR